jgi:hypothetical protein
LLIIALCSFVMSAFTVTTSYFIAKVSKFMDASYNPMDAAKMIYE